MGTRVSVGKVRRPWGVDGSVSVTAHSEAPAWSAPGSRLFAGNRQLTVKRVRRAGAGGLAVTFAELRTPEEAESLRGAELEADSADLPAQPDGVYYHYQVIGASAVTPSGRDLGVVSEILDGPENDIFVISRQGSDDELLVPAVREFVRQVDVQAGRIIVVDPADAEQPAEAGE